MSQSIWIILGLLVFGGFVVAGVVYRFRGAPTPVVAPSTFILSDEDVIRAGVAFHNLCRRAADQKLAVQMTQGQIDHNVGVFTGPYQSPTTAAPGAANSAGG